MQWICFRTVQQTKNPGVGTIFLSCPNSRKSLVFCSFPLFYFSIRDINTTHSTWNERTGSTSYSLSRIREHINNILYLSHVCENISYKPLQILNKYNNDTISYSLEFIKHETVSLLTNMYIYSENISFKISDNWSISKC